MKFLADENIDKPVVERLRGDRHVVQYVKEMDPGISDEEVILETNKQSALLLTADKDFGELVFRQGRILGGVILLRLAGLSPQSKSEIVALALQKHSDELAGHFTVISHSSVRIRKQPS